MSKTRNRVRAAVLGAATIAAVTLPASGALAADQFSYPSYISSNSGGANLRTCASTTCKSLGYMPNNTTVYMQCWTDAQWVYPPNSNYASNRWFKVDTFALGGSIGYVHSSLVTHQWPNAPRC